ncbi:hypothetical protein T484DRAFT_1943660 [Baffinella frigidus]|nr:hypothetical protein T484DRAFT_1943660 [Cryptophyta sp. CCMP2293]
MGVRDLWLQQFREITVVLPTWFLSRSTFDRAGRFPEGSPEEEGEAEDLVFFYQHIQAFLDSAGDAGGADAAGVGGLPGQSAETGEKIAGRDPGVGAGEGCIVRVGDETSPVLRYRYLAGSGSWRTPRRKLLRLRAQAFERRILGIRAPGEEGGASSSEKWSTFTVWGAGRDGRQFVAELSPEARARITAICDVDPKKIGTEYYNHRLEGPPCRVPIIHFSEVTGPVVVCVSRRRFGDQQEGELEQNVRTLGNTEGKDLWYFV